MEINRFFFKLFKTPLIGKFFIELLPIVNNLGYYSKSFVTRCKVQMKSFWENLVLLA